MDRVRPSLTIVNGCQAMKHKGVCLHAPAPLWEPIIPCSQLSPLSGATSAHMAPALANSSVGWFYLLFTEPQLLPADSLVLPSLPSLSYC